LRLIVIATVLIYALTLGYMVAATGGLASRARPECEPGLISSNETIPAPFAVTMEAAARIQSGRWAVRALLSVEKTGFYRTSHCGNATALELLRRAWLKDQSFECRTRFLALADNRPAR